MRLRLGMIGVASATLLTMGLLSGCTPTTPIGAQTSVSAAHAVTASVVAVDKANREITLRGHDGREATFDVPPEVRNFNQIMAGDTVRLSYRARMDFLVTGSNVPVSGVEVMVGSARAPTGQMPAGLLGGRMRLTVQILSVDRNSHTVTFRLPDGSVDAVTAVNPANFVFVDGLRAGTNVLVTVTQAVAVAVDRV